MNEYIVTYDINKRKQLLEILKTKGTIKNELLSVQVVTFDTDILLHELIQIDGVISAYRSRIGELM